MRINQLKVEKAVKVISDLHIDKLPKEMKGDISSFGASIIQAGLLPSVLFYSEGEYKPRKQEEDKNKSDEKGNADDNTKARRALLMKIVFDVMEVPGQANFSQKRPLLDYIRQNLNSNETLDMVTEAALAVKIAMRAFEFSESSK